MKLRCTKMLVALTLLLTNVAHAKLDVVATLPDYAAIAREIGRDKINVTSLAKGSEDAHFVDAKPSFIRTLNKADVLLEGGADLEIGWLPSLLASARNPKINPAAPGFVVLSEGVHLLDTPSGPVDRSMGDVHPGGNPHYWLDPANGKIMAEHIAAALGKADPSNAAFFDANAKAFNARLEKKLAEWKAKLEPHRGTKVVTYHKSFDYFLEQFGLVLTGTIEPKPGVEPSPTHIKALVSRTKSEGVKLVLVETFRPRKTPENVAENIGAKLLVLPDKVGANEKAGDYIALFDYNVSQIAGALSR